MINKLKQEEDNLFENFISCKYLIIFIANNTFFIIYCIRLPEVFSKMSDNGGTQFSSKNID